MTSLPTALYRCAQVKALDKTAIEMQKVGGFELMQTAGQCAFDLLRQEWPDANRITVFCGSGNNAGDGYIVAVLAKLFGCNVQVLTLADPQKLVGDARLAYQWAREHNLSIAAFAPVKNENLIKGVVVDALLGIGVRGDVRENYAAAIASINSSNRPVLSIDIPSGICGDSGRVLGKAVKAAHTITFIGLKRGMFTADACDYCGNIVYASLGVKAAVFETQKIECTRLNFKPPLLSERPANSHKGMFGRVVVIGGDRNYGGAGIMAAESALLSGAGLVYLASRPEHVSAALARRPELMVSGIESSDQLKRLLEQTEVLVLGPGVGQSEWSTEVVECALQSERTMLMDADGLNLLASKFKRYAPRDNWVLTPHPAEAGRLLGISTTQVQADRFAAAKALHEQYGGVIVLKGAGTIIADNNGLYLCTAGNPAMSTPGMGDILSGIIGGLLAQGLSLSASAKSGVWAHATAADNHVTTKSKHLLATDIYADLKELW